MVNFSLSEKLYSTTLITCIFLFKLQKTKMQSILVYDIFKHLRFFLYNLADYKYFYKFCHELLIKLIKMYKKWTTIIYIHNRPRVFNLASIPPLLGHLNFKSPQSTKLAEVDYFLLNLVDYCISNKLRLFDNIHTKICR